MKNRVSPPGHRFYLVSIGHIVRVRFAFVTMRPYNVEYPKTHNFVFKPQTNDIGVKEK